VKWYSHRIITGISTFILTNDFVATTAAIVGSILPDKLEGRNQYKNFPLLYNTNEHRKFSHLLVVYAALVAVFFLLTYSMKNYLILKLPSLVKKVISHRFTLINLYALLLYVFTFFFFGALLHVLQDLLFGGVPIFTPYQKFGLKLKTGGVVEHIILFLFFVIFVLFIKSRGI
jgi:inner membrane protein